MIARHIAELLYHHECVIVPGLGGFIKAYSPAQILHSTHEFSPPSGKIAFNGGLSANDGILANHLATSENTSYREALYEVKLWAGKCQETLKQGKNITLEGIGVLFLNASGKIEFTPSLEINFNADSFGLPVFFAKPVALEIAQLPENKSVKKEYRTEKLRRLVPETLKWAAVLAPFVAFTLWGALNGDVVDNYVHNYSGMYAWVRSTPGKTATVKFAGYHAPVKTTKTELAQSPAGILAKKNITFSPGTVSYTELAKNHLTIADPAKATSLVTPLTEQKYHIIGGAFRDQNNALKLIDELVAKGFPAAIVDTSSSGLFIVSMKGCDTYKEASDQLDQIKKAGFSASWIMKKHNS
ncbi:MAG: SPOR domain-containing protein [Bacteroidota bacterium]